MTKSPLRLSASYLSSLCLAALLLLSGCASDPKTTQPAEDAPVNLRQLDQSAEVYIQRAADADTPYNQYANLLLAADAYLTQGKVNSASNLLRQLSSKPLDSVELSAQLAYLNARLKRTQGNDTSALAALNATEGMTLPRWQSVQQLQLQAEIYQDLQQSINELRALSSLSALVSDEQRASLNDRIWRKLRPLSEQTVKDFQSPQEDWVFNGWLALAYLVKHYAVDPSQLSGQLTRWQGAYPNHPGAKPLPPSLQQAFNTKAYQPKQVAVLLPLSGNLAAQAEALRYGIVSRTMENPNAPELKFYDSSESAEQARQLALSEGADFVIGPLRKAQVEQLSQTESSVPQLMLNLPDQPINHSDTFYFALSPVQEAQKAADYMYKQGIRRPLALHAQTALSQRMAKAFAERWLELSDEEIDLSAYVDGKEMQKGVRSALEVDASQARIAAIKEHGNSKIKADFRSRRDVDGIYLIASAAQVKLVKPFIDVNISVFAEPIPVYAASRSHIKPVKGRYPRELDGLMFSDMPWLLQATPMKQRVESLWPQWSLTQQRLFVMGYDAAAMIDKLAQMRAFPGYQVQGQSGALSADETGVIQRDLSWGKLKSGRVRNP
ncbi:penicillin-binding protein activator [Paraferrimonas sedimenticola]|uniref:Penicillin-binding protein activator n=1 Tax=Paraferrimonas sedimenticola TaxID=375674 RepID=A0AA37W294_9GAMM|nr:penicillin-binding protein activator [Paraferrimonas sedimenticola]GLP97512.1 penicillin-binding protein activator [Paraferrimonas sedimenticola]